CSADTTTASSTTPPGKSASTPTTENPNSYHHPNPASKDTGSDIDHDAKRRDVGEVDARVSGLAEKASRS
ncbi:MAG TPA: hypothetical protein VFI40_09995, partial [Nocardioides sp.]|nr:hypothetical protein [Nocardioides sp.]